MSSRDSNRIKLKGKTQNNTNKPGISNITLYLIFFLVLTIIFLITTVVFIILYIKEKKDNDSDKNSEKKNKPISDVSNYYPTQERFIPVKSKMTELEGGYLYQGRHDILDTPYFNFIDIYNTKSSGSLVLLENFKTYQQTSEISCGPASLIMAVYYLDGTILDEAEISEKAGTNETGTLPENLEKVVKDLGYSLESKYNFSNDDDLPTKDELTFSKYIKESLKNKQPIIVCINDWGGHYSVIIGYDDMGTDDYISDDIIILADPYDISDHISDGYTIFSYERFYWQMSIDFFENTDLNFYFIKVLPKK